MRPRTVAAAALLLAAFLALGWLAQARSSVTVDEFAHLPAGCHYWRTGDFALYGKNPPLVKLLLSLPLLPLEPRLPPDLRAFPPDGWLPWTFATDFMRLNQGQYLRLFAAGRSVALLLGCALGLLVFLASRRLHGDLGGLVSLAAFALCPSFLAHAGLATTDVGASLFVFLALLALLRYLRRPGWRRAALAGAALGLAALAKFSALPLAALFAAAPLLLSWPFGHGRPGPRAAGVRLGQLAAMAGACLAVIAACYGGAGLARPLGGQGFQSRALAGVAAALPALPSPLPATYLAGLDAQLVDAERGEFPNYLRGRWYRGADWSYYPVALATKVPLPTLALVLLALLTALPWRRRAPLGPEGTTLLLAAAWLLAVFMFTNRLQIGVRYLLPAFPPLLVLAGRAGAWAQAGGRPRLAALAGLLAWLAAGTAAAHPRHLAYFNPLAGGAAGGHRVLLDSNLDWGQDLPALADWLRARGEPTVELAYFGHVSPRLYGIDYRLPGGAPAGRPRHTAISAQLLFGAGEFSYPMLFHPGAPTVPAPLLLPYRGREPVAVAGSSIWVFENDAR